MRAFIAIAIVTTALLGARAAAACGAAYPGGPVYCTMEDAPGHRAAKPLRPKPIHLSLSWSYTSTTLTFGEGRRADLERHAVFAGTELALGSGLSFRFGAGGILGGRIDPHRARADFGPGATAFAGATKSLVDERGAIPFVQLGGVFSFSRVGTRGPGPNEAPTFTALDVRAALTAGKTLGPLAVYATARVFGGPIFFRYRDEPVTGTDLYKYQLGGGLSVALPSRLLDAFVEGIAAGERGLSAGIGSTF